MAAEPVNKKGAAHRSFWAELCWSGREDLNLRPPRPERGALTGLRHSPFRQERLSLPSGPNARQLMKPATAWARGLVESCQALIRARVAQRIEQGRPKPCVGGSTPSAGAGSNLALSGDGRGSRRRD
jgi:hypothetical protein